MRSRGHLTKVAIAGAAFVGATAMPSVAHASSFAIPFTDPYQRGSLTLCNRNGQAVTSGSLLTVPFIWSAVSNTSGPKGYKGGYLAAYQPIEYEDPSDWSGYQLTGPAAFQSAEHPTVQATDSDSPILWAEQQYPPHWDNLIEIRMLFTSPDLPTYNTTYPAAVIQITGNSWKLVSQPAGVACSAGKATAIEDVNDPASESGPVPSLVLDPPGGPAHNAARGGGSGGSHSGGKSEDNSAAGTKAKSESSSNGSSGSDDVAAADGASNKSSDAGMVAALSGGAAIILAVAGIGLIRRRRST